MQQLFNNEIGKLTSSMSYDKGERELLRAFSKYGYLVDIVNRVMIKKYTDHDFRFKIVNRKLVYCNDLYSLDVLPKPKPVPKTFINELGCVNIRMLGTLLGRKIISHGEAIKAIELYAYEMS